MTQAPLERLARRASAEPSFLGWQLAAYARVRGFDDAALAGHLGCAVATLAHVRLCGAVRTDRFREDVAEVATKFGLDPVRLAEAVKPVPGAEVAGAPAGEPGVADTVPGTVLAARDRSEAP